MKYIFVFSLLLNITVFAQPKPKILVMLATDVVDATYGVSTFGKIQKIAQSFNQIKKSLGYDLVYKSWTRSQFEPSIVSSYLKDSLLKINENDILVFYYIGRGVYSNPSDKNPSLEFRNKDKKIELQEFKNLLNTKKGRLKLLMADCYESFPKSRGAENSLDITKKDDSTAISLGINDFEKEDYEKQMRVFSKLSSEEKNYYLNTKEVLFNELYKIIKDSTDFGVRDERITMQLKRLSEYPKIGFPNEKKTLLNRYELLPSVNSKSILETRRNFDCVIDSLFKLRNVLSENDPLNLYLDSLITIPVYVEKDRGIEKVENFDDLIIRKLFFSTCGQISIAQGVKSSTSDKLDYTASFYKSLSTLTDINEIQKIDNLKIDKLLEPNKRTSGFEINKNETKCPNAQPNQIFFLPKGILTSEEMEGLFNDYINTNDLNIKNILKNRIIEVFEKNAVIEVKKSNFSSTSIQKNVKISLIDYLSELAKSRVIKVELPMERVKRNQNFSKVVSVLIVEN